MQSFALRLTFVMRFMATRKWPIGFAKKYNYILESPTLGKSGYLFSRAGPARVRFGSWATKGLRGVGEAQATIEKLSP